MALVRIGVDIGGTFTDFVGWKSMAAEGIQRLKVPSTPPDFEQGFKDGFEPLLDLLNVAGDDEVIVMHGTTVNTNIRSTPVSARSSACRSRVASATSRSTCSGPATASSPTTRTAATGW